MPECCRNTRNSAYCGCVGLTEGTGHSTRVSFSLFDGKIHTVSVLLTPPPPLTAAAPPPPPRARAMPPTGTAAVLVAMSCSGLGPAVSTLFTNPLEVCKTRLQLQGTENLYAGPLDCARKTWRAEGLRGLQAGVRVAAVREGSKTFFRYGLFAPFLAELHDASTGPAPLPTRLLAGAAAGAVSAVACNPLDLLKCQMQANGAGGARHYADTSALAAVRRIIAADRGRLRLGGVRALWAGVTVSVPRSMVSTAAMMTTVTFLRDGMLERYPESPRLATGIASLAGAAAQCFSIAPLDIVRARVYAPDHKGRRGPLAVAVSLVRQEGIFSFWAGAGVNFFRYAPHAFLSFQLIDGFKSLARRWDLL